MLRKPSLISRHYWMKLFHKLPAGLNINIAQSANDFLFASIHEVIEDIDRGIYPGVYRSIYLLAGFAFYIDSDHCYSGSP